jgi:hypothetical protein
MNLIRGIIAVVFAGTLAACDNEQNYHHSVYMLVDTSGTYAKQVGKAQNVVNYLLGTLQPGDFSPSVTL